MRQEFEMTQEDLDKILYASQPVRYMVAGGMPPISPQESANAAWKVLGEKMGFDFMTVQPIPHKGDRYFTANRMEKL